MRMTSSDYMDYCDKTEAPITQEVIDRMTANARLMHAMTGLCTESGEIADAIKRHVWYGKPLDVPNLIEEAGDLLWYLGRVLSITGLTFEDVMGKNYEKLSKRYGQSFSPEKATNRDLDAERAVFDPQMKLPFSGDEAAIRVAEILEQDRID